MKHIVYKVCEAGSDGRGPISDVFVSLSEKERDRWLEASPDKCYCFTREEIVNLDQEAHELWGRIAPVQRLALLRTDCPMWQPDYIEKKVGSVGLEQPKPSAHPISWDMHNGAPPDCSRLRRMSCGHRHNPEEADASEVVRLIMGQECLNKMLRYVGCDGRVHRYIYSYDCHTLGVVEFDVIS